MTKWFKNVTDLNDLKVQFRRLTAKHHPDRGGDNATMTEINIEFDALFPIWKKKEEKKKDTTITETPSEVRRSFYTANGWQGDRYDSNITTKEIAKIIRMYCKEKYPTWKFSVTSKVFSGGSSIDIAVIEAPQNIFDMEYCKKAYERYLEWGSSSHAIAINVEKELNDHTLHWQIYNVTESLRPYFTEHGYAVLEDVFGFMQSYNYDDSDSMIDYFDCGFYHNFSIGTWNKPFSIVPKTARIKSGSTAPIVLGDYQIEKSKHSKTKEDIWLVKIKKTLDKETYLKEKNRFGLLGGYYSKYTHSFIFKQDPTQMLEEQGRR